MWYAGDDELRQEMDSWLAQQAAALPSEPRAIIRFWVTLKKKFSCKAFNLNGIYKKRQAQAGVLETAQMHALYDTAVSGGADSTLDEIIVARQAATAAIAAEEEVHQTKRRKHFVHLRERPNRGLTARVRPRQDSSVTALRAPNGTITTTAPCCARVITRHWASISGQPATTAEAQATVLGAMERQGSPVLEEERAEILGNAVVTEAEVRQALRRCALGKAPGADGIPADVYKKHRAHFAPLLASVFTAIGTLGEVPNGFLESIITVIPKGGDPLEPGNYRPISLTHCDYRVLARVLAARLGKVLPDLIDPVQTAFIKGRNIGQNTMTLQFLAAALRAEGRTAFVAFCDIRKAYDTIDRCFLFSVAERMGLGQGFLAWLKLLHTDTRSAATVDGFVDTMRLFLAGAKQGCPLAPLLYNILGQALLCWLRDQGLGVTVAGTLYTAGQFADDLEQLLGGAAQAAAFLAAMEVFAAASGQELQPAKTKVLPIGAPVDNLPTHLAGMPMVSRAKALGLVFQAFTASVTVDWDAQLHIVGRRLRTIVGCQLSVFGRATATNTYALSAFLYHAEYAGLPSDDRLADLYTVVAAAVERGVAPHKDWPGPRVGAPPRRKFAGIAAPKLVGHPSEGGVGLMALGPHVASRQAKWLLELVAGDASVPWIRLGRHVLQQIFTSTSCDTKGLTRLALLAPKRGTHPGSYQGWEGWVAGGIPPVLMRMMSASLALPPVRCLQRQTPGPWCYSLPVWGNPVLADDRGGLENRDGCVFLRQAPLLTVGAMLDALELVKGWTTPEFNAHRYALFGQNVGNSISDRETATEWLEEFAQEIPQPIAAAAVAAGLALRDTEVQPPSVAQVVEDIIPRLGWQLARKQLKLASFKVKAGTQLILSRDCPPQRDALIRFAQVFGFGRVAAKDVRSMLQRMWKLPWSNDKKEVLWRLVLDAHPTIGRLHKPGPCGCGTVSGPSVEWTHVYYGCPAARMVLAAVTAELQGRWSLEGWPLAVDHLWMAQPPVHTLHQGVWDVVCLAVLRALDGIRKYFYILARQGKAPGPQLAQQAGRKGVAKFWSELADFIGLGVAPLKWRTEVPSGHPFLYWEMATERWLVNRTAPGTSSA
jgi:hypothetical protein